MRLKTLVRAVCILALVTHAGEAISQLTIMSRTPELQRLDVFVGEWQRSHDAADDGAIQPVVAHKVASWAPGDTWMAWEVRIEFSNDQVVHGRRHIAWDRDTGVYRTVWIDTQSAHIIDGTAHWEGEATFVIDGAPIPWHDGHEYRFRTRYEALSNDEIRETGFRAVDDGEFQQYSEAVWARQ